MHPVFVTSIHFCSFWLPVLLCPRVWTSLENGRVAAKPPGPPVEGTVLHYSCHAGFILEGRNISHCTKLGKWDAPKPTCLCECPRAEYRKYVMLSGWRDSIGLQGQVALINEIDVIISALTPQWLPWHECLWCKSIISIILFNTNEPRSVRVGIFLKPQ